jgi:glycine/D-amino acid oxidase-like deaminating enzyme
VSWQPTPDGGVRVETQQGVYTAQRLVLTAGVWLPQLVPALQVGCASHTTYDTSPSSLLL